MTILTKVSLSASNSIAAPALSKKGTSECIISDAV